MLRHSPTVVVVIVVVVVAVVAVVVVVFGPAYVAAVSFKVVYTSVIVGLTVVVFGYE